MATGSLGHHKSTTAGTYTVYTVPVGKRARVTVNVINDSGTTNNVVLYVAPTGTPTYDHTIQLDKLTVTKNGYRRPAVILKAGEVVCYKTDQADTHVVVMGIEEDASTEITEYQLITTNAETVLHANTGAKAGTFNVVVTLTEGATTDSCVCKLYVTTTNAAGGYLIQSETLRATSVNGFESVGIALSTTDKLVLVTSGISGKIATRNHGFEK